jgi:PHD/YefM family antitoxin component YafN of YafNO toxin-antitoxin module
MENQLTAAELKRRGLVAIEEGLQRGPLHLVKHNKLTAVVLRAADYEQLRRNQYRSPEDGLTALQWLLATESTASRSKEQIDADLATERSW